MGSHQCSAAPLRRAAVCGTLAASIYNTQPWLLQLTATSLQLWSDPERQLLAHDPDGRLLMMSCGCALFNARVSLACDGVGVVVQRATDDDVPPSSRPQLLATVTATSELPPESAEIAELASAVDARRTNRHPFTDQEVSAALQQRLSEIAHEEGALLLPLNGDQPRIIDELTERAVAVTEAEPSHRAERRAWSVAAGYASTPTDDPNVVADPTGGLPMLLAAPTETPHDWLRAGEALQRVLLELTRAGLQASLSSDAIQVPEIRRLLRESTGLTADPLVVLRVGHAPPSPATRRRRLVDVIIDPAAGDIVDHEAAPA